MDLMGDGWNADRRLRDGLRNNFINFSVEISINIDNFSKSRVHWPPFCNLN